MLHQGVQDRSLDRATRLYFKELSGSELLSVEEERALARRARTGDRVAEQKLIESNLRFVVKVAKQFRRSGLPLLELVNEGNVGLIEAVRRFDPERGIRFVSYAVWWIRQAILSYISRAALSFRISPHTANILYRISRAYAKGAHEGEVSDETLARFAGVSVDELRRALQAVSSVVSLDHPAHEGGEKDLKEILNSLTEEMPDQKVSEQHLKRKINSLLALLSKAEQTVLRLRFGLDDENPLTLQEIGERLRLSRERIRQLESKALMKVRNSPGSQDLALYLN